MKKKTVKVERRIENRRVVFYRWYPKKKDQPDYPTKEIPEELFTKYSNAMHAAVDLKRQIDMYFEPIQEKKIYVAKNHERFDYETLKYVNDGEFSKRYGEPANLINKLD